MINILCFGDSNTFGTDSRGERHSWNTRWPGRLQVLLGPEYYMIEEGMNGRTTVWDDPLEPGRYGIQALPTVLQSHKLLDLVILLLGTNDCKAHFHAPPGVIAKGMENLCHMIQGFDYGEGHKKPKILAISPIHIGNDMEHCPYVGFNETAPGKSMALAPSYQELPETEECLFLDAASLAGPSGLDQLRMDVKDHGALTERIAEMVKGYFEPQKQNRVGGVSAFTEISIFHTTVRMVPYTTVQSA